PNTDGLNAVATDPRGSKMVQVVPDKLISEFDCKVTIPAIGPHSTVTIYLVNQSRSFVEFVFPKDATTMMNGKIEHHKAYLIRPEVTFIDKVNGFFLPPTIFRWPGETDYPEK